MIEKYKMSVEIATAVTRSWYHSLEVYQDHLQQSAISFGELAA